MRVPENWDRPTGGRGVSSGGASYYPPLRKSTPTDVEGSSSCATIPQTTTSSSQHRSSSRDPAPPSPTPPCPLWRRDDVDSSSVFGGGGANNNNNNNTSTSTSTYVYSSNNNNNNNNGSSFGSGVGDCSSGASFGGLGSGGSKNSTVDGSYGASTFSGSASSSIYGSGSNGSLAGSTSMFAAGGGSSSSSSTAIGGSSSMFGGSAAGSMFGGSTGPSKESATSFSSSTFAASGFNGNTSYSTTGSSGQNGSSYFGSTNGLNSSGAGAGAGTKGTTTTTYSYGGSGAQNGNSIFGGTTTSSSTIFSSNEAIARPSPSAPMQAASNFSTMSNTTIANNAAAIATTPSPTPNRWSTSSFTGSAAKLEEESPPLPMVQASPGEVDVRGSGQVPGPWVKWDDVGFPARLKAPLTSAGFPCPTVIQQHAWPILSSGRDLIGIAKTGSGKTLAFLLPGFSKLTSTAGYDPRGPPAILVLAPTRELAVQIEQQAKQFGGPAGMRAACLYGGAPKGPQLAELRQRPQVLVATPGRLNDLLDPPAGLSQAVDVKSVGLLVLDEADRMLDMGFEPQIRKIIGALPKDRQTAMFTATWPVVVRRLASDFLRDPIEVRVGEVDDLRVNPDVEQRVVFCTDALDKERRLGELLREAGADQAIIFVNTKRMCESVAFRIDNSVSIHGDKDQRERDVALNLFKSGTRRALVATDVAARGLDIKSVKLVINFDPPNRDEDYVHRVGRTGRAGKKGTAITLLTNEDATAARFIADLLRKGKIPVPEELERKLVSGELRSGGGRDRGRGPSRIGGGPFGMGGSASRARSVGVLGGRDPFGADDFDFGFDRGARPPRNDFMNVCATDCPTW